MNPSANILDLLPGDVVKTNGPGWADGGMNGREYTIDHINEEGQAVFTDADGIDWIAYETGSSIWRVDVVVRAAERALNGEVIINDPVIDEREFHDPVNHPSHYKAHNGFEAIEVMEAFNLHRDGRLFNAGKYILRAGQKDKESQDVRKAIWYLERYAANLEELGL